MCDGKTKKDTCVLAHEMIDRKSAGTDWLQTTQSDVKHASASRM